MIYEKKINDERINSNIVKTKGFFELKKDVHILKISREWLNGTIKEISKDYLIMNERKKGEIVVFFLEMFSIEELEERE